MHARREQPLPEQRPLQGDGGLADADGRRGTGRRSPGTSDTGQFWFFSSQNVEMVVKVLNGCGFNQRYWVFAGGLTNVQVTLTVTDMANGHGQDVHESR